MVVPLTVPSTTTCWPVVIALAVVDDARLTVTFWPVDVDSVKPDADVLATVPAAPPAAGPDRALEPAWPPGALDAALGVPLLLFGLDTPVVQAPITSAITTAPAARAPLSVREDIGELLILMALIESAGRRFRPG
jgi:hypothetical protein